MPSPRERPTGRKRGSFVAQHPWVAPAALAVASAAFTVGVALGADLPIRDPDGIFGERFRLLLGTVLVFAALDVLPRAFMQPGRTPRRLWRSIVEVSRARWTKRRAAIAITGVVSFYITYVAYRNLKSYLPFFVDQDLDVPLLELDRILFGSDPATLLHDLLGTGAAAHFLSFIYLFFLAFVPISVGAALIWSMRTGPGLWWTMALGLNWTLGVVTYYLVPSLGPIFVFPSIFDALPLTGVSELQDVLAEHRALVISDPSGTTKVQSIAGFASLHISIVFSAVLIAHHLRVARLFRGALWGFLALTQLATIYFGWHYVLDNVAGLLLGAVAVYLGALTTGQPIRRRDSAEEVDDVVGRHGRKEDRVDPVEHPAVGTERAPRVLDPEVALDERLEEVPRGGGEGHGAPDEQGLPHAEHGRGEREEDRGRHGAHEHAGH